MSRSFELFRSAAALFGIVVVASGFILGVGAAAAASHRGRPRDLAAPRGAAASEMDLLDALASHPEAARGVRALIEVLSITKPSGESARRSAGICADNEAARPAGARRALRDGRS